MKRQHLQRNIYVLLAFLFVSAFQACSGPSQTSNGSSLSSLSSGPSFQDCKPKAGVSGSPKTIEEAVALINSLPRPVSVGCFVAALDRPLKVSLTNSTSSAQPAVGSRSPRIFIVNDKLNISVVPEGPGQDFVEFSYMVSATMSVKAELEFPILNEVSTQAPYNRVRYGSATSCGVCHGVESRFVDIGFAEAFYSIAFQPQKNSKVSIDSFRNEATKCNFAAEPKRCEIISALFKSGTPQNYEFPAIIPFFF